MATVELENAVGTKVIRLEIRRVEVPERVQQDKCAHLGVIVDPMLATIRCTRCDANINPVEWIATLTEYWDCIERITEKLHVARAALAAQQADLELRRRAKCEHCHRITRVKLTPGSELRRRTRHPEPDHD